MKKMCENCHIKTECFENEQQISECDLDTDGLLAITLKFNCTHPKYAKRNDEIFCGEQGGFEKVEDYEFLSYCEKCEYREFQGAE